MIKIRLDKIRDNPFQPRTDYGDIPELAAKIRTMKEQLPASLGLIHPPNARLVVFNQVGDRKVVDPAMLASLQADDSAAWVVELSEGHRRQRAFRLLAESDPDYLVMPLNLAVLDDEAMDDIAWSENRDRKDLSPIEEAQALQRTMEIRKLTQEELGSLRQLGRSTVANKLRLLGLPDALKTAVHQGKVSERVGLSYLPVLDIPPADLKLAMLGRDPNFNPANTVFAPHPDALMTRIIEQGDLTGDQVRAIVERIKEAVVQAKKRKWEEEQRQAERGRPASAPPASQPVRPTPATAVRARTIAPLEEETPELRQAYGRHVEIGSNTPLADAVMEQDEDSREVAMANPAVVEAIDRELVDAGLADEEEGEPEEPEEAASSTPSPQPPAPAPAPQKLEMRPVVTEAPTVITITIKPSGAAMVSISQPGHLPALKTARRETLLALLADLLEPAPVEETEQEWLN